MALQGCHSYAGKLIKCWKLCGTAPAFPQQPLATGQDFLGSSIPWEKGYPNIYYWGLKSFFSNSCPYLGLGDTDNCSNSPCFFFFFFKFMSVYHRSISQSSHWIIKYSKGSLLRLRILDSSRNLNSRRALLFPTVLARWCPASGMVAALTQKSHEKKSPTTENYTDKETSSRKT